MLKLIRQRFTDKPEGRCPPNAFDKHIGRRIRVAREECGLSQTAVATALDVSFQQLQKYEKGSNRISASNLWLAAKVLDRPIMWFFEEYAP